MMAKLPNWVLSMDSACAPISMDLPMKVIGSKAKNRDRVKLRTKMGHSSGGSFKKT